MIRRGVITLAIVALLVVLFGAARRNGVRSRAEAGALLQLAESAEHFIPHTGHMITTTFLGGTSITSEVRVTRLGPRRSRIDYLSPPLRGVYAIQEGERVRRYDPSRRVVHVDEAASGCAAHFAGHLALLLRNYDPVLAGQAAVAGRDALRLELIHRPTRHRARLFWIDAQTGLILRRDEFRYDGSLSARTAYRNVSFGRPSLALFTRPFPAVPVVRRVAPAMTELNLSHRLGASILHPRYVPAGYEYEGAWLSPCGCSCGKPVANLRYCDGLRTLSVFQCAHCGVPGPDESIPLPHGNVVRAAHRGIAFFFIGEADPRDLRRMARSLP